MEFGRLQRDDDQDTAMIASSAIRIFFNMASPPELCDLAPESDAPASLL